MVQLNRVSVQRAWGRFLDRIQVMKRVDSSTITVPPPEKRRMRGILGFSTTRSLRLFDLPRMMAGGVP